MSLSTLPGPTEGSWSMSPTITRVGGIGNGLQQSVHQGYVDHGGFVDYQSIHLETVVVALSECSLGRG